MSDAIAAIFCTLVIAAGWYYLARSQFVARLQEFESPRRNKLRRRVRRTGAMLLIFLGFALFWLILESQRGAPHERLALEILLVGTLLIFLLLTVMVDVYLTIRLRQTHRRGPK